MSKIGNSLLLLSGGVIAGLCGCSGPTAPWEEGSIFSSRYNFSGASTLIEESKFESFSDDRLTNIIESSIPSELKSQNDSTPATEGKTPSAAGVKTIDTALFDFYGAYYRIYHPDAYLAPSKNYGDPISTKALAFNGEKKLDQDTVFYVARNEIQDQILAASVQRCNAYKKYLRHLDGSEGFALGALSTIFGGVGAIVTGEAATRLFSGLAGISSGVGAEARQNIFSNLASSIIVPGIEKRRSDILQDIINKRCHSITTYTVSFAIADALKFHSACTMDVGIEEASQSVATAQNPGLDTLESSLQKFAKIQAQMASISNAASGKTTKPGNGTTGDAASQGKAPATTQDAETAPAAPNSPARSTTFEKIDLPVDCSAANLAAYSSPSSAPKPSPTLPPGPPWTVNFGSGAVLGQTEIATIGLIATSIKETIGKDPTAKVTVTGYTDSTGTATENSKISLARAQAVIAALEKNGINEKNIVTPPPDGSLSDPKGAKGRVATILVK